MKTHEIIATLLAMHKPECQADSMVYEVWNDGEITLTKGGELYGQRTLHQMAMPLRTKHLPVNALHPRYNNSRIMVATHEEAQAARALIASCTD